MYAKKSLKITGVSKGRLNDYCEHKFTRTSKISTMDVHAKCTLEWQPLMKLYVKWSNATNVIIYTIRYIILIIFI